MTDHDRELLEWVAEELLGWEPAHFGMSDGEIKLRWWVSEGKKIGPGYLESWHGIGLVVDAFKSGKGHVWKFNHYLEEGYDHWWLIREPWTHVFEAARKAVEGL